MYVVALISDDNDMMVNPHVAKVRWRKSPMLHRATKMIQRRERANVDMRPATNVVSARRLAIGKLMKMVRDLQIAQGRRDGGCPPQDRLYVM